MNLAAPTTTPARLVVITLSNIGDLVLTTPVFEALARAFPGHPIDVIADARSSDVLRAAPYVGEIFHYDKRATWRDHLSFIRARRACRYTLAVDLRTVHLGRLLRAVRRLRKRQRRVAGQHAVVEHFTALLPLLGPAAEPPACRVYVDLAARQRSDHLLDGLPGDRWLAVAPGANFAGKKWPREEYRRLLDLATSRFDAAVILGSHQDSVDALHLASISLPTLNAAGKTSLREAAALLARCTAFIGNDSGLGHLAAAVGTPTLTVFGPGDPARYRPWGPRARIVCAPGGDLRRLPAGEVWSALDGLLSASVATG